MTISTCHYHIYQGWPVLTKVHEETLRCLEWCILYRQDAFPNSTSNQQCLKAEDITEASLLVSADQFLKLQPPKTHSFIQSLFSAAVWSHEATGWQRLVRE